MVSGDAHGRRSADEVQSSTGTTLPAEEGGAGLEDAVGGVLSCAAAKAVATCLLELKCTHGARRHPSQLEGETDHRHVGLAT